ncbi:MAG: septal ring lytic transglycosylase RlpA family protein [Acidobacteriota bacterium]
MKVSFTRKRRTSIFSSISRIRRANRIWSYVVMFGVAVCLCGCGKKRVAVPGVQQTPELGEEERVGYASWYGDPYHGRRTSNGETYNKFSMTAAHRTLPFDTLVRVNNLENGKVAQVRINDRGPFVRDRIIDLSYAAAKEIDMIGAGTARVRLEILRAVNNPFPLAIQVGSFHDAENAEKLRVEIERAIRPVMVRRVELAEGVYYRVIAGEFQQPAEAAAALRTLRSRDYDALIIRLDPVSYQGQ